MGYLPATGAYMIIALAIGFIVMVAGLFVGHIILFDSITLGIIAGVCCNLFFTLHLHFFMSQFLSLFWSHANGLFHIFRAQPAGNKSSQSSRISMLPAISPSKSSNKFS